MLSYVQLYLWTFLFFEVYYDFFTSITTAQDTRLVSLQVQANSVPARNECRRACTHY